MILKLTFQIIMVINCFMYLINNYRIINFIHRIQGIISMSVKIHIIIKLYDVLSICVNKVKMNINLLLTTGKLMIPSFIIYS